MRWDIACQAHLQTRQPFRREWLLWVEARNRTTSALEPLGLWSGPDDAALAPKGASRVYHGRQGTFEVGALSYAAGTSIGECSVTVGANTPEVQQLLRGTDTRFAEADLFCALFSAETNALLGFGEAWTGFVDAAPITIAEVGGTSTATITLLSSMRAGTELPASKKSDEMQTLRQGDRFRQYANPSSYAHDWWGAKRG